MEIKYDKPIKEIYLSNGESDGYETKEFIFDVDYEDVIKAIFNTYYSEYDYETFKMMVNQFDADISGFIYDDEIKKELFENYERKNNETN